MTDLKTKIARGEYEIDSRRVAEEIIAKVRTVSRVRAQLTDPRNAEATGRSGATAWERERGRVIL